MRAVNGIHWPNVLREVAPGLAGLDGLDGCAADAKPSRNRPLALALSQRNANGADGGGAQPRSSVLLAARDCVRACVGAVALATRNAVGASARPVLLAYRSTPPPLDNHIGRVLGARPSEETRGVAAQPVVAAVANARAVGRDRAVRQFEGHAVRAHTTALSPRHAIALGASGADPRPTRIRPGRLVDLGPERLNELFGGMLCGHLAPPMPGEPLDVSASRGAILLPQIIARLGATV